MKARSAAQVLDALDCTGAAGRGGRPAAGWPRRLPVSHSVAADDGGKLISWPVRIAVAVAVFSLGLLVGAAVAAWVVPPM
jgi:hypothetical protein